MRMAKAFDADPDYSLENVIFSEQAKKATVYDDAGPTAVESLKVMMEEEKEFITEDFRKKFDREMNA